MPPIQVLLSAAPASLEMMARLARRPGNWLVLPSERQAMRVRDEAALPNGGDTRVLPLRSLAARVVESCQGRTPESASSTLRRLLVREMVRREIPPDGFFGRVRDTAGFPAALSDLLRELKQAGVGSEELIDACEAAAGESPLLFPGLPTIAAEIARVYGAVESEVHRNSFSDEDDLIPMAIQCLAERPRRDTGGAGEPDGDVLPRCVNVAGFHSFTLAQISLMVALAHAGVEMAVHLQFDETRPFLFETTRRALQMLMTRAGAIAAAGPAVAPHSPNSRSLVAALTERLFLPDPDPLAIEDSITVLEAPGEYVEAEMIAVRLRALHEHEGMPYDSCAIVARSVGEVAPRFRSVMQRAGIPLSASTLEPLAQNPAVRFLMRLFELTPGTWPREELLRVLRSSYLGLDLRAADRLERLARSEGVQEGPERWLELLAKLRRPRLERFLRRLYGWREEYASARSPVEQSACLRRWAIACLRWRWGGPDERDADDRGDDEPDEPGSAAGYSFLPASDGAGDRRRLKDLPPADRMALWAASRVARELRRVLERFHYTAAEFRMELLNLWQTTTYSTPAGDGVRLLDAYAVLPGEFPVVFITGLLEGSFPRHAAEDPFFRDEERLALRDHGVQLTTALEAADEERILFYRAAAAARDRLYLSYSRVTGEGRDCLPSFYLDEVRRVLPELNRRVHSRTLADVAPAPEEANSDRDRACAFAVAAGDWRRTLNPEFADRCAHYSRLLQARPFVVARTCDGAARPLPFVLSTGWCADDRGRSFGVTDIETFATCPYRFFARKRLRLRSERGGPDNLDKGEILHKIVQQFLTEVGDAPLPERDACIARLNTLLDEQIALLRRDARPYQLRLLRQSLRVLLPAFVDREREYREYSRLRVLNQELVFGYGERAREDGATTDPASCSEPLTIRGGAQGPVRIHGRIDRVDVSPAGEAAILDYKLGPVRSLREMESGASLQLPLYLLAAQDVFGLKAGAAFYDSFDRNERTILIRQDAVDQLLSQKNKGNGGILSGTKYQDLLNTARARVIEVAEEIAACRIEPVPGDHCRLCDFGDVCRQ